MGVKIARGLETNVLQVMALCARQRHLDVGTFTKLKERILPQFELVSCLAQGLGSRLSLNQLVDRCYGIHAFILSDALYY